MIFWKWRVEKEPAGNQRATSTVINPLSNSAPRWKFPVASASLWVWSIQHCAVQFQSKSTYSLLGFLARYMTFKSVFVDICKYFTPLNSHFVFAFFYLRASTEPHNLTSSIQGSLWKNSVQDIFFNHFPKSHSVVQHNKILDRETQF